MTDINPQHPIAYFCAEYGIQSNLPIYAGGLGVLAGDTIKAAADANLPFVGIGLLYRGERQVQFINHEGLQEEHDMDFDPLSAGLEHVYKDDQPMFIRVHMTEIDVWCRVWKKTFTDNVTLYLLDTDTDQNQLSERGITHPLYSGTEETALKQQLILGIGGVKLLHTMGINPGVIHINEGRPAFVHWQLIREYMDEHGMDFIKAHQFAKSKTVYTNHTLVTAGLNMVDIALLKRYGQYYADKMKVSIDQLLEHGINEDNGKPSFSMTTYGLNTSRKASGVSQMHTDMSKEIWPGFDWHNITNGVHMPSWQDREIRDCDLNTDCLWEIHLQKKQQLANFVKDKTGFSYDPNSLVISWARRLAGYKRFDAVFADIERLRAILKHSQKPVQFLAAGKAHVSDKKGKLMLQKIIKYMAKELSGAAIFIPNYDLEVAAMLVKGSDLWLNIPEYGKEACGTSGMKAISNGVLKCTVPDGWAYEVDWEGVGWTLNSDGVSSDLYSKLETEIIPMFYNRDGQGIPREWLERMKKSIQMSGRFSAKRMLDEYLEKLY
jgi:glycogen phosphorylase